MRRPLVVEHARIAIAVPTGSVPRRCHASMMLFRWRSASSASGSLPFDRFGFPRCSSIRLTVLTMPSMAELAWASTSATVWNTVSASENLVVASRSVRSAAVASLHRASTPGVVNCSLGIGGKLL